MVSLRTNLTEMKRIENELRTAKDMAESASRSKSNFLANMSHEIRTPRTSILGFTDLLLQDVQDEEQAVALKTIQRNGQALLSLMNDILDLSEVEAGMLTTERAPVASDKVMEEVQALLQVRAEGRGIGLRVEYPHEIAREVSTDGARLKQILINLVSNAIKFTEVGGVVVRPKVEPSDEGSFLRIDVVDTGIGMTPERCERVFQPFEQADSSTTRSYGGTGLGLAISQRMAEALGGRLEVDST